MELKFSLGQAGQQRLGVADLGRSEAFYGRVLRLRRLAREDLRVVYDLGGAELVIEQAADHDIVRPASPVFLEVSDIVTARRQLEARGVRFIDQIRMVAGMAGHDLWVSIFTDPDGHHLALMSQAPRGFQP